jgi:ketosteroid isomerase-like protein
VSQENVEIVRAAYAAYNAGHYDALVALYAPDAEFVPDASVFPEAAPVRGREEIKRWLEANREGFVEPLFERFEVLAVGADRVLAWGEWGGKGAASGIETYSNLSGVWTVTHGEISKVEYFFDHGKALKAVGLEE